MASPSTRSGTQASTSSADNVSPGYPSSPLTTEVAYVATFCDSETLPTCTSSDATWNLIYHEHANGCGLAIFTARVPSTTPGAVTVTNTGRSGTGVLTARLALAKNQNASGGTYYGVIHSSGSDASAGIDLGTIDVLQADDATIYSFIGFSDNGTLTDNNLYGFTQIWTGGTTTGDDAQLSKWRDAVTDIATVNLVEVTMAAPAAAWNSISLIMTSVEYVSAAVLAADPGSYAVTGSAATLKVGRRLDAQPGSYAVSGTDAALKYGRKLSAAGGAYTVTGVAAALIATRKLLAEAGEYLVNGSVMTMILGKKIVAEAGSYTHTGTDAMLKLARKIEAQGGSYAVTGADAALLLVAEKAILADGGSYSVDGAAASLLIRRYLSAIAGSYAVVGSAATLRIERRLIATAGGYAYDGADASLVYSASPASTGDDWIIRVRRRRRH